MRTRVRAEVAITALAFAVMCLLSLHYRLPIVFPTGESAAFIGLHYVYPMIGLGVMSATLWLRGQKSVARQLPTSVLCFVVILFVHFNMKLWIPQLNPARFDPLFWSIDQSFDPLVEACKFIRTRIFFFVSYQENFYFLGFAAMFYISFLYHGLRTPGEFRKLVLSALILQFLGSLGYLALPAVGPFIYERGVNPIITETQQGMWQFYLQSAGHGADFLRENGGANFVAGLAAMPSLHAAGAFLFFLFAWRHARVLVPLYAFVLFFILVTAVASRWHYLVDLPMGILLAVVSYTLAGALTARPAGESPDAIRTSPSPALG